VDDDLRLAWSNYLQSQTWDYFVTVTFREPLPLYRAERVQDSIYGTLKRFAPNRVFLGAEPHVSQLMHFHGLYKCGVELPAVRADEIFWRLFNVFGRSTVELIKSTADVADYCAKYCVKACEIYNLYTQPTVEPSPRRRRKRPGRQRKLARKPEGFLTKLGGS